MFIRNVTLKLNPNTTPEFNRLMENEILPLLRKQPGFRDEITFIAPERSEVVAISFWETKENCETYNKTGYPEVLKIVSKFIDGTPKVETFELLTSTLHKLAAKA
jgi:heme-degrading monooxygenase HmoA